MDLPLKQRMENMRARDFLPIPGRTCWGTSPGCHQDILSGPYLGYFFFLSLPRGNVDIERAVAGAKDPVQEIVVAVLVKHKLVTRL